MQHQFSHERIAVITYDYEFLDSSREELKIRLALFIHRLNCDFLNQRGRTSETKQFDKKLLLIKIGRFGLDRTRTGVSESIGLIRLLPNEEDKYINSVFERNLAEAFLCTFQELFEQKYNVVLIQGPMFPKLRGRVGYRHFSHNLTIASVEYNRDWVIKNANVVRVDDGWEKLTPTTDVDSYTRTFGFWQGGDCKYSVELFGQMIPKEKPDCWNVKYDTIRPLIQIYGPRQSQTSFINIPAIFLPSYAFSLSGRQPNLLSTQNIELLINDYLSDSLQPINFRMKNGVVDQFLRLLNGDGDFISRDEIDTSIPDIKRVLFPVGARAAKYEDLAKAYKLFGQRPLNQRCESWKVLFGNN